MDMRGRNKKESAKEKEWVTKLKRHGVKGKEYTRPPDRAKSHREELEATKRIYLF